MKLIELIKGDIRLQYKYGFYALYALFTIVYITVLHFLPTEWKEQATALFIFSDPVLIGLMFIGAIILFEKSENVMPALSISPISTHTYILSKVISIAIISLLSGLLIALFSGMKQDYAHLIGGILLGSILFTLVGISLSAFISSLNSYILVMIPTLTLSVTPAFVYTMGYQPKGLLFYPSVGLIELMSGNFNLLSLCTIIIVGAVMYILSHLSAKKMMTF